MPSNQAFCNPPAATSGGRKRAVGDADEEDAEKRPKLSENESPHSSDQSNPLGTSDGAPFSPNEMLNPSANSLSMSSSSNPGPSNPSHPTEVLVFVAEKGPMMLSPSGDPSEATGPWQTTGLEPILSSEQGGCCTDQTAEDPRRWSWSCSSSSCISSNTPGSPSPSSCCSCSREGDSPSRPLIPNGPNGPDGATSLQGSGTENVASEASFCGRLSTAEVEDEIQVPECLWQQETSSDPDLEELNAVGGESFSNDADNGRRQKACDLNDQKVSGSSGSLIPLAKSSMWKSFINPSDPSGLKLILQRIPDPLGFLHNNGKKGEVEVGCSCESAAGIDSNAVIQLCRLIPGDSLCLTDLPKANEREGIASSDPCSCSWCCNSCSCSSSSSGSVDQNFEDPTAKVDEKKAGAPPEVTDKTGNTSLQKSTVSASSRQGGLKEEEEGHEPEEEDTASCRSCLSGFVQATHEMDQGVALCPSDTSSGSWAEEAPDGYSKLVPSLKYS